MVKNSYLIERAQCQIDSLTECSFRRIFFWEKNILFLRLLCQRHILFPCLIYEIIFLFLRLFSQRTILFCCLFALKIILEIVYSIGLLFLFGDYSISELIWYWGYSRSAPILGEVHSVKALFSPCLLCLQIPLTATSLLNMPHT